MLPQLDINNTIDHRPEGDEKWFLENEKTVTQFCRKLAAERPLKDIRDEYNYPKKKGIKYECSILMEASSMNFFFFSSRRRHTRLQGDWSSDVCSSDLRQQDLDYECCSSESLRRGPIRSASRAKARESSRRRSRRDARSSRSF